MTNKANRNTTAKVDETVQPVRKERTLSDYIRFDCKPQTFWTDRVAEKMHKAINQEPDATQDVQSIAYTIALLYSLTPKIVFSFDGTERPVLRTFKEQWEALDESPAKLWEMRKGMPTSLVSAWIDAFNEAQLLFDVPDEQKPLEWLTPEQQAEAQQSNSPLAVPAVAGKSA